MAQDPQKMSPREYVQSRQKQWEKLSPQLVYYYIRSGKIEGETCVCGRLVIDVDKVDLFFKEKWT